MLKVKHIAQICWCGILAVFVLLPITAAPSMSGILCGKGKITASEQTVVAHLDEASMQHNIGAPGDNDKGHSGGGVHHEATSSSE